jgi:hypothetical protein
MCWVALTHRQTDAAYQAQPFRAVRPAHGRIAREHLQRFEQFAQLITSDVLIEINSEHRVVYPPA